MKHTRVKTPLNIILFQNLVAMAANVSGKMQYPNKQTLWKNDIVPPRRTLFNVTNTAPIHGIIKAATKTVDLFSFPDAK